MNECNVGLGKIKMQPMANPDTRLGNHINADIRLGANLICFPVSHVYFFAGWVKVYSQTGLGGHGWILPPGSATECNRRQ